MKIIVLMGIGAVLLWVFWASLSQIGFSKFTLQNLALWGDSFGGLNALFSAAAFVAVLTTIRMQSKELKRQQREIEEQSNRLERSELNARLQQFEATFFQLFELCRELREKVIFVDDDHEERVGQQAFDYACTDLKFRLSSVLAPQQTSDQIAARIGPTYEKHVHIKAELSLGPYFRTLYTILRRISENGDLSEQDKARYGNLVRSNLSSPEVALISANALTPAANDLKRYLIEFRILKYLPEDNFKDLLRAVYPAETFKARD